MHWFQWVAITLWSLDGLIKFRTKAFRTKAPTDGIVGVVINGLLIWGLIAFWGK